MLNGLKMAQLRREKVGGQTAMATRLGVTIRTVSRWETGDAFPEAQHLAALAEILGVEVADLFGRRGQ